MREKRERREAREETERGSTLSRPLFSEDRNALQLPRRCIEEGTFFLKHGTGDDDVSFFRVEGDRLSDRDLLP